MLLHREGPRQKAEELSPPASQTSLLPLDLPPAPSSANSSSSGDAPSAGVGRGCAAGHRWGLRISYHQVTAVSPESSACSSVHQSLCLRGETHPQPWWEELVQHLGTQRPQNPGTPSVLHFEVELWAAGSLPGVHFHPDSKSLRSRLSLAMLRGCQMVHLLLRQRAPGNSASSLPPMLPEP